VSHRRSKLFLVHGLARVERDRLRDCLARIRRKLVAIEAERVLRLRLAQLVADERKRRGNL